MLRTPLTVIVGNAELIMRLKMSESDIIDVGSQIVKEPVLISDIMTNLQGKYPEFECQNEGEAPVNGNSVLLLRLMDNLLANAFAVGTEVVVLVSGKTTKLINNGPPIHERTIRKLNNGRRLAIGEYQGNGQGVIICHEIMKRRLTPLRIASQ